jgi:hypothetical protein
VYISDQHDIISTSKINKFLNGEAIMTTTSEKWIDKQVEEYEKLATLSEEELEDYFAEQSQILNEQYEQDVYEIDTI